MEDYERMLKEEAAIAKVKEEYARETMLSASRFGRWAILCAFVGKGALYLGLWHVGFVLLSGAIVLSAVALCSVIARIRRMGIGGSISGTVIDLLAIVVSVLLALGFIFSGLGAARERGKEVSEKSAEGVCKGNLHRLGLGMNMYKARHSGAWPEADKWCDEVMKGGFVEAKHFRCPDGGRDERCHYAMNSKARPYSRRRRVLLFESKGGWNQHGGAEMLSTERHGGRGCHILFNNGDLEFVGAERVESLRW